MKSIRRAVNIMFLFFFTVTVGLTLFLKQNEVAMFFRDMFVLFCVMTFGIIIGLAISVEVKINE